MFRNSRTPAVVLLLILGFGILSVCFHFIPRHLAPNSLVIPSGGATKVLSLQPLADPFPLWLNGHSLLAFHSGIPGLDTITKRDVDTGRGVRMLGLEKRDVPPEAVQVSLDGKQLLWHEGGMPFISGGRQLPKGFVAYWTIKTLSVQGEASQTHSWTQTFPTEGLLWLSDSRHFIEMDANRSAILVYDTLHHSIVQRLKPRHVHDLDSIGGMMQMAQGDQLVCTSAWHGLEPVVAQAGITILPLDLRKDHSNIMGLLQHNRVIFPSYAHIWANDNQQSIAFSRVGDKVAWWLKFDDDVPLSISGPAVQPLIRSRDGSHVPRGENRDQLPLWLYVCNIDGSGMHSLGKLGADRKVYANGGMGYDSGDDLQWLPDGKHLSFEYHDSIWVVPAS